MKTYGLFPASELEKILKHPLSELVNETAAYYDFMRYVEKFGQCHEIPFMLTKQLIHLWLAISTFISYRKLKEQMYQFSFFNGL